MFSEECALPRRFSGASASALPPRPRAPVPADRVLHGRLPGARPDPVDHRQLDDGPQCLNLLGSWLVDQDDQRLAQEAWGGPRSLRG
eukprot:12209335-Alexandrium_andersonii.AAC.1